MNSEVTLALEDIVTHPFQKLIVSENFQELERFMIITYNNSNSITQMIKTKTNK